MWELSGAVIEISTNRTDLSRPLQLPLEENHTQAGIPDPMQGKGTSIPTIRPMGTQRIFITRNLKYSLYLSSPSHTLLFFRKTSVIADFSKSQLPTRNTIARAARKMNETLSVTIGQLHVAYAT